MKHITSDNTAAIIRFDKDEDVCLLLKEYLEKENVTTGFFSGIGACKKVILSYFNVETKKYEDKIFDQNLEIVSLSGNIAKKDGKPFIHCHGVFSDAEMKTYGGHVKELIVSVTCEIALTKIQGSAIRKKDSEFGLHFFE